MGTIVVRTNNSQHLPDTELIIQKLKNKGSLKELSNKGQLTVDELKKTSLNDYANIFVDTDYSDFISGDILIFENGNFSIYTGEASGE